MPKAIAYILLFLLLDYTSVFSQSAAETTYETHYYKIGFPNQFEKTSETIPSNLGQLIMTIISYEPNSEANDSNYVYMVMETDYPDSSIHSDKTEMLDRFFTASINGAVKNVNGKLIEETKGLTGIYPNRTVEIDYQNGLAIIKMTMILRKSKMIFIQTITNTQNYPNSAATKFVKSFVLK